MKCNGNPTKTTTPYLMIVGYNSAVYMKRKANADPVAVLTTKTAAVFKVL